MRGWTRIATINPTDATGQDADKSIAAALAEPENRDMQVVDREQERLTPGEVDQILGEAREQLVPAGAEPLAGAIERGEQRLEPLGLGCGLMAFPGGRVLGDGGGSVRREKEGEVGFRGRAGAVGTGLLVDRPNQVSNERERLRNILWERATLEGEESEVARPLGRRPYEEALSRAVLTREEQSSARARRGLFEHALERRDRLRTTEDRRDDGTPRRRRPGHGTVGRALG